jgi:hypothetical protein
MGTSLYGLAKLSGLDRRTLKTYEQLPRLDGFRQPDHQAAALGVLVRIARALKLTMRLEIGGIEVDLESQRAEDVGPESGTEKLEEVHHVE